MEWLNSLPNILDYGVNGLIAIFIVASFSLLQKQSGQDDQGKLVTTFMSISFILIIISSFLTLKDKEMISAQKEIVTPVVIDRLEMFMDMTQGKGEYLPKDSNLSEEEILHRRVKKAVFQSFLAFQANENILRESLKTLVKRRVIDDNISELIMIDLPELKILRRNWLKNEAIPALQKARSIKEKTTVQSLRDAEVSLPKDVEIIPNKEVNETVYNFDLLYKELKVITNSL